MRRAIEVVDGWNIDGMFFRKSDGWTKKLIEILLTVLNHTYDTY